MYIIKTIQDKNDIDTCNSFMLINIIGAENIDLKHADIWGICLIPDSL